jgi:SAM-dependent methyltransferase
MYSIRRWCRIDKNGCIHCSGKTFDRLRIIDDDLARTWELSQRERDWFDDREGNRCRNCRMSKRVRMLLWSLRKLYPDFNLLHVLHLNQINELSTVFSEARSLTETVYSAGRELGAEINGLSNQDMCHLTFDSNHFDLALHSETLEHVLDYEQALSEAWRVLKPGGWQVYSIPLLHGRTTRQRIIKDHTGRTINLLPLSTHGLDGEYPVVWEFGGDFLRKRKDQIRQVHYDNYWKNSTVFTILERKS